MRYDADGVLSYPRHADTAPESALAGYLDEARALFAGEPPEPPPTAERTDADDRVTADFEHLRWFDLPRSACLGVRRQHDVVEPSRSPCRSGTRSR